MKKWKNYEEVARHLLNEMATNFGVGRFDGKCLLSGESGTTWEIDARGCRERDEGFLIVECKRYPKKRIDQATVASLAWTIRDTGALGGILVSPVGMQTGAKIVAESSNIHEVILNEHSTTTTYLLEFINRIFIGQSDTIQFADEFRGEIADQND